jgi:uncharacterized protein YjbI with pentapeptide repeats
MANPEHYNLVASGGTAWNDWRKLNPEVRPDLSRADLSMEMARRGASSRALLMGGFGGGVRDLSGIDLSGADLTGANLTGQVLTGANLRGADLSGANLAHAHLVRVDFREARLNGCHVYGISTWDVDLTGAEQADLSINPDSEPNMG